MNGNPAEGGGFLGRDFFRAHIVSRPVNFNSGSRRHGVSNVDCTIVGDSTLFFLCRQVFVLASDCDRLYNETHR